MKNIFILGLGLMASLAFGQVDKIYKHSGEIIEGQIKRVGEFTVEYTYDGEGAIQSLSKYSVNKVFYGKSTRIEDVSDKIEITDDKDWGKVIILEDKSLVAGLKKGDDLKSKTGMINFRTGNGKDERAEKVLKQQAAEVRCPFILLLSDKMTGKSAKKTGSCYKYQ
ncbi:hypothetical protein N5J53_15075 [Empedobacter sp. GD03644]|uniref:hypothetical protein n=1 Tax=Empedobacter sp. GD03644 TaxID=2975358 RepID=UPI002449176A|nr:hypothetical protein [Empedobacter sp. GD03644]MDH2208330.1 hypothetical protein [Empedobacter sp. GD03644]